MRTIRENAEHVDTLTTIFLHDADGRLTGALPVARLFLVEASTALKTMTANDGVVSVVVSEQRARVTEIMDKYNLMALPVVDEAGKLVGAVTADDIISVLRQD